MVVLYVYCYCLLCNYIRTNLGEHKLGVKKNLIELKLSNLTTNFALAHLT